MSDKIRILLTEDHTIVRQGLARLLDDQPDLKIVGEATDGHAAVKLAMELKPDIVIMDIAMPRMNGIEAAKRITKKLPRTKILVLSMYSHEHYIHQLIESGISGYLLKDADGRDIVKAIHAAINDETFLSPMISKKVVDAYRFPSKKSSSTQRYQRLTNREREIFQMIAEGYSTRSIADLLCLSISTVKSHRAKITAKLEVDTTVKLVHYAIQLGLVDPDL